MRAYLPCETELLFQVKGRPALRPYRRSSLIDFLGSAQTAVDLAAEQQRQVDQLNALFEPQRALIESCRKLTEPLEAMRRLFNVS